MTDKALGWTLRIGGVAGVVLILWLIQVMLPDFYSTMWWLMIRGDLDGLTDYIASFGYAAIGVSVFMIAFVSCSIAHTQTSTILALQRQIGRF